ncbi:MAG TPA: MerR family transcriptional regulator [Anaerolineales bacterium]|nr:MerR family transcriptional regulator [Anaerolineales bacterium]
MFTVKQLSKLAGVTPRTLHHYDAIGLLKPSRVGDNGYRYYGEESLLQLQQILFYRELDLPLEDIKKIVSRRDFDVLEALESHKDALKTRIERLNVLLSTGDNTINDLKGKKKMNPKGLFEGFSEEEQEKYAEEAAQTWDAETVHASNRKWKSYSDAEKKKILVEGKALYNDLAAVMLKGAASKDVQAVIARWHKHMQYFWSPDDEQLLGLADLYNDDPRFKANYEKVHPGLAEFIREAVKVYVKNRKK